MKQQEPAIEITKEELRKRFAEYNRMYFKDKLQMPTFRLNKWFCGIYGSFSYDKKGNPVITISNAKKANWTGDRLKNVLIHEMIHYWMERLGWLFFIDNSLHLLCYQAIRIYLNRKYGLHITTWGDHKK